MPHRYRGERTLMRIFICESDRCEDASSPFADKPLFEALLLTLKERGFAGATVLRGVAGFGASAAVYYDRILSLSTNLPVVVEVVEREERIQQVLPVLHRMIGGGLITMEKVQVILYPPREAGDPDRVRDRVQGLEPEG